MVYVNWYWFKYPEEFYPETEDITQIPILPEKTKTYISNMLIKQYDGKEWVEWLITVLRMLSNKYAILLRLNLFLKIAHDSSKSLLSSILVWPWSRSPIEQ